MKGSSKELQFVALAGLLNDPYTLGKCAEEINESYFTDMSLKLIYRCLKTFYQKYMTIPKEKELVIAIGEKFTEEFGDLESITQSVKGLYEYEITSEDYAYEKIIDFIRRNRVEKSLGKIVKFAQNGEIDLDLVAAELRDAIDINFNRSQVFVLSDVSSFKAIREEALGSSENPIIMKFFIEAINSAMQYKGLIPGTVTMITAPPGLGKTTLLINQNLSLVQQGFTVLHVFLGDMSKYDGLVRYLSCLTGVPSSVIVDFTDDELKMFVQKYNMSGFLSNLHIASYAADQLSVTQLIEEITTIQRINKVHYNAITIDYDENLREEQDSMYKSGGAIYNKVALFAVLNRSAILIASQPKPEFWSKEILTLESAAESSKKQKIIDMNITMGSASRGSTVGSLFIAKNRRGEEGKIYRIMKDGKCARIKHITEDEYNRIKQTERAERRGDD